MGGFEMQGRKGFLLLLGRYKLKVSGSHSGRLSLESSPDSQSRLSALGWRDVSRCPDRRPLIGLPLATRHNCLWVACAWVSMPPLTPR